MKFNDVVISVLVGFLLGSLFKIWPFIEVVEYTSTNEPLYTRPIFPSADLSTEILIFAIFSIIGFLMMWILEKKIISLEYACDTNANEVEELHAAVNDLEPDISEVEFPKN